MEIEVQLFASLRYYLPKGTKGFTSKIWLREPMPAVEVLKELKMPDDVVENIMILMINGAHAKGDQILYDGDVLMAVPVASGG